MAHSLGDLSLICWPHYSWAYGVTSWQKCVAEQNFSPHGQEVREGEGSEVSLSAARDAPKDLKTCLHSLPLEGSTK